MHTAITKKKDFVMQIKQQVPEKRMDPDLSPDFQDALNLFVKWKVIEYWQSYPCHIQPTLDQFDEAVKDPSQFPLIAMELRAGEVQHSKNDAQIVSIDSLILYNSSLPLQVYLLGDFMNTSPDNIDDDSFETLQGTVSYKFKESPSYKAAAT